jgi:serine/threonine protein kinase
MRLIGQTFGKYRITEHLGSGGMSEVYKAYQPGLDRYVAIKVLHSFLAQEEDFLTRFQREAKFAAMLRHPNIIQVYDFDYDEESNSYYMVMEYVEGESLKTRLQKKAKKGEMTPLEESIRIVIAIANALDYAHQHGTVHRDVKPANIMFNQDEQPILTDFGIAKMVDVAGLTASGAMVGTPAYMAPEQGMGQAGDERADIYSLGVILYQLTTGHRPFDADTPLGVALKHINAPLPPPIVVNPNLPHSIEAVTLKALAKDPDNRYQTAQEFATELKKAAAGEAIEPPPGEPVVATPQAIQGVIPQDESHWEMATLPSAPAISVPASSSAKSSTAQPKRRPIPIMMIVAIAAVLLVIAGVIALFATGTGQRMIAAINPPPTATATLTPTPIGDRTPTPNLVSTEIAIQLATRDAVQTLEATLNATLTPIPSLTPSPTADLDATATASCVFDMQIVSDPPVLPSVLAPGQQFTKRWTIENTGTCAWPPLTQVVFVDGDELEIVAKSEVRQLEPSETTEVRITLQAPFDYNTYASRWQLQYGDGQPIGGFLEASYTVAPSPTPTDTPTPQFTATPTEPLWMSDPPSLSACNETKSSGQIAWGYGGGPSSEYRFFYSQVDPSTELDDSSKEFIGFPHTEKYFTTSGTLVFPVPEECGRGTSGRCGSPEEGFQIVWQEVQYSPDSCPPSP